MNTNHTYQTKGKKNKKIRYWGIGLSVLIVLLLVLKSTGVIGGDDDIVVETSKVEKRSIIETITASGKLRPEKEVAISADVSGEIIELNFAEGDRVKKGDLLLRIKPEEYQSSLEDANAAYHSSLASLENARASLMQAEALLKKSKTLYERYQKLKKKDAVSDTEFERIESEFLTANAQYESARQGVETAKYSIVRAKANKEKALENLEKTSIYAPMDGIVTILNNEEGERVVGTGMMQGSEIMKIADLNLMEVNVEVNENDIIRIELGDTAEIEVDAFTEEKFKGIVTEIANSSKQAVNLSEQITTFEVKIRILESSYDHLVDTSKNVSTPFRPGMSAMVDIRTTRKADILCIPILSVTTRKPDEIKKDREEKEAEKIDDEDKTENQEVVFIYENGKAIITPVKIGIQDDYYIEITEGLEVDQEVVSGPYSIVSRILKDGLSVKVKNKQDD